MDRIGTPPADLPKHTTAAPKKANNRHSLFLPFLRRRNRGQLPFLLFGLPFDRALRVDDRGTLRSVLLPELGSVERLGVDAVAELAPAVPD